MHGLDEPTTNLHAADVGRFVAQMQHLVDAGNTVMVVERDLRVIAASDWVIDMGPGGGDAGGRVLAIGTPTDIARSNVGVTARYLQRELRSNDAEPRPGLRPGADPKPRL